MPESPFGAYWSAATHDLIQQIELDHEAWSSSWQKGNITIADGVGDIDFPNFIAQHPPIDTAQRKVIAPGHTTRPGEFQSPGDVDY